MSQGLRESYRTVIAEAAKIRRDPRLALWSLFILFFPFYVFRSGLPQPADWMILILGPLLISEWNRRLAPSLRRPMRMLLAFTAYTLIANLVWSCMLLSFTTSFRHGFLLAPTFYMFDALLFLSILLMYQRYGARFLWLTSRLALASLGIQVVLAGVMRIRGTRSDLMFNNPNQLGYYALLTACLILIGQKRIKMSTVLTTIALVACCYLALMSASKAALASIGTLGIVLMIGRFRTMMLATVVLLALVFTSNPFSRAIDRAHERFENDRSYGFIQERGYDRIARHPRYWLLGSGEGAYERWAKESVIGSHELHSSLGTLFFCYGIAGTVLFSVFMLRVLLGADARTWLVIAAPLAYGMTHQGLRFMLFWVMLGMAVGFRDLERRSRASPGRKHLMAREVLA